MPDVFPDYPAPVIRDAGEGRELVTLRWDTTGGLARLSPPQQIVAHFVSWLAFVTPYRNACRSSLLLAPQEGTVSLRLSWKDRWKRRFRLETCHQNLAGGPDCRPR